jgi:hypothetical protein
LLFKINTYNALRILGSRIGLKGKKTVNQTAYGNGREGRKINPTTNNKEWTKGVKKNLLMKLCKLDFGKH